MISLDRACRLRDCVRDIENRAQLLSLCATELQADPDSRELLDRLDVAAHDCEQAIRNWEAMHDDNHS